MKRPLVWSIRRAASCIDLGQTMLEWRAPRCKRKKVASLAPCWTSPRSPWITEYNEARPIRDDGALAKPRCRPSWIYADNEGENDRRLIISDTKTRPLQTRHHLSDRDTADTPYRCEIFQKVAWNRSPKPMAYCTSFARKRANSASLIDPAFFSRSSFSISSAALYPTTRRSSSRACCACWALRSVIPLP